jgi:hypothetical protein
MLLRNFSNTSTIASSRRHNKRLEDEERKRWGKGTVPAFLPAFSDAIHNFP